MDITVQKKKYDDYKGVCHCCQYHVLFCTKYRRKVLEEEIAADLKQLLIDFQEKLSYKLISADVAKDHVHLMLEIPPHLAVSIVVGRIKGQISHVLRGKYSVLRTRIPTLWTRSILISSLGNVSLTDIEDFLEHQKGR